MRRAAACPCALSSAGRQRHGSPLHAASSRHRRRRLPRLPSVRSADRRRATTCSASTTSTRARKTNIAHLLGNPRFELMRHDVTFPLYVEVDEIYNLACPASPIHYQRDPVQTTKTSVHGAINMLGLAKRRQGADPAGLHQRGVRRPASPPADRGLLGQRQPDRPPLLLRRGQALRRDPVLRLPPPARPRHQGRRGSSTPTARACTRMTGAWSPTSSSRRCRARPITIYGDGQPDPLVLLRRRPRRRPDPADGHAATRSPARQLGNPSEFTMLELAEHHR